MKNSKTLLKTFLLLLRTMLLGVDCKLVLKTLLTTAIKFLSTLVSDHFLITPDDNTLTYISTNFSGLVLGVSNDDGVSSSNSDTTEASFS